MRACVRAPPPPVILYPRCSHKAVQAKAIHAKASRLFPGAGGGLASLPALHSGSLSLLRLTKQGASTLLRLLEKGKGKGGGRFP